MSGTGNEQFTVRPLSQQLLLRVVIFGAVIIGLATIASYYISYSQNKDDTLAYLRQYLLERRNLENETFSKTHDYLMIFRDEFLKLYLSDIVFTEDDFWDLYFVDNDKATRMKRSYFDESFNAHLGRQQGMSSFIGNNQKEFSSDLQRRLIIAHILVNRFGPAWWEMVGGLHASYPENAITIYYPSAPWGLNAKPDLKMNELGVIASTLIKNNPERKPVWTGLYYDETAGNWTITYQVPVDHNGRHLINPSMDVSLEAIINRLGSEHPDGAYNFLIRDDGFLVAYPDKMKEEQKWKGQLSLNEIDNPDVVHMYHQIKNVAQKPYKSLYVVDDAEKDNYLLSAYLPGPGWWFVMVYPKSLISQNAHEASRIVLILGFSIFLLYYLVIYFVINRNVRNPLRKLLNAVTMISKGDYDAIAENPGLLPVMQQNEIGQFSRSFIEMSLQIRNAKQELEKQVSERTRELALANEAKDKFLSIIAHDLRGPIGTLSVLFNEIAQHGSDIDDDLFSQIGSSTKLTSQLLENLLTWARSQKDDLEFNPVNFSIAGPLQENINLFQTMTRQKRIDLTGDIDPDSYVFADLEMVTTISRNLISNAVKFTRLGGKITVSARQFGGKVRITVSDTGVGMTPEVKNSLFRIDKKKNSTLGTGNESGTGLGLILSAEFVKKHGGEIGCDSEIGKGSSFWFSLPAGKEAGAISHTIESEHLEKLTRIKVLIVDDNSLHLETGSAVLKELNLNFETAFDGNEAVERYRSKRFDLVLMDIEMPGMNGIEATQIIRRDFGTLPKIIALSSYSRKELEKPTQEALFDGYLNKPLIKTRLLNVLQNTGML